MKIISTQLTTVKHSFILLYIECSSPRLMVPKNVLAMDMAVRPFHAFEGSYLSTIQFNHGILSGIPCLPCKNVHQVILVGIAAMERRDEGTR